MRKKDKKKRFLSNWEFQSIPKSLKLDQILCSGGIEPYARLEMVFAMFEKRKRKATRKKCRVK